MGGSTATGARPQMRYVASLDGIRALCALAVIGYHMRLRWCGGGLLGVTVLFVLSGYMITSSLMREYGSTRGHVSLGGFWKRRFWRLIPTVLVFVAVTGAVCAFLDPALFTKMRPDIVPAIGMFINWTKIFAEESYFAAAGAPSPLTHFWSLAIEAQFYLVWPPIFYLLMKRRVPRKGVCGIALVLAAVSAGLMAYLYVPGVDPTRVYYGTDTRAMSLLLGCWLAIVWPLDNMSAVQMSELRKPLRIAMLVLGPLCVVGLVAMMALTEGYTAFSYYGGILGCSLLTVGAIASLVPAGSILSRILGFKPLSALGKRAYAIYVWHFPVLELMNPLKSTLPVPWWRLALELVIILALAEVSYRLVEVPFRRLGEPKPKPAKAGEKPARRLGLVAVPAVVVLLAGIGLTGYGLATVEPVTAAGAAPDAKVVMHASLKKPLQDGVADVVLIGDSVSLGAYEQLSDAFPHGIVDTRGERQPEEAAKVLEGYLNQGIVGDQVVISIGTNGLLDRSVLNRMLKAVGPQRTLWFVNLRSQNAKDIDNNELLAAFASANDNVRLIDWHGATVGHDDWLGDDGIHLTWDGRDAFTKLVVDTMGYSLPNESNTVYDVTIIGDTVCLDAAGSLATAYPRGLVDTADGREVSDLPALYATYASQRVVGDDVIFAVGNEELLNADDLERLVAAVSKDKRVWLVNVRVPSSYAWASSNNQTIQNVAANHANATIIDWYNQTSGHGDWLQEDGLHLSAQGAQAYADLIASMVGTTAASTGTNGSASGSTATSNTNRGLKTDVEDDENAYDDEGDESGSSYETSGTNGTSTGSATNTTSSSNSTNSTHSTNTTDSSYSGTSSTANDSSTTTGTSSSYDSDDEDATYGYDSTNSTSNDTGTTSSNSSTYGTDDDAYDTTTY